jgi:proteasome lid subunit RPN8/RPN11
MKRLLFNGAALEAMTADGLRTFPNECCGFLFGTEHAEHREFTEILVVDNSSTPNAERRFEISPADYMRAERKALASGLDLLGVYHSHPSSPAVPSIHDLRVALPTFSYVILSVYGEGLATIRSWQLNASNIFSEETILNKIPKPWQTS